jgi:hypothetical protein
MMASELIAQVAKPAQTSMPDPQRPHGVPVVPLGPREMLRAMVARDRMRQGMPGATVEIIGYDSEVALRLLSLRLAEQVRMEFRSTDKRQHQELYEFMHQDPGSPSPVMFVPMLAGGKAARADEKWLN